MSHFVGVAGELKRRQLQKDYSAFVEYTNEGFRMTKFHRYLCQQIQEFLEIKTGKALDILLLSVPPRHGKSFTVTETLPAWYLGNHPKGEVIVCSYQTTVAESFSRPARDKFNEFAPDIWHSGPNTNVQTKEYWETSTGGKYRAAGLDAGITRYGAELFIIDDPIKNAQDAMSEAVIKRILDEMGPSVQSRIYPGGKLIVIQTRWVENDPVGFIKENWSEFIWKDINLPCECEDPDNDPLGRKLGESLMGPHLGDFDLPSKICNDNLWLASKKRLVIAAEGERTWNSLYQGHPTGATGNLFDETWWKSYKKSDFVTEKEKQNLRPQEYQHRKQFEYMQLSIDATFKDGEKNDFVAMGLRGIYQGGIYLHHMVNKRMGFVDTIAKIKQIVENYPEIDELVIEDKANGPAIADMLRREPDFPPVVTVNPMGGKVARAQAIAPSVRIGMMYIAEDIDPNDIDWHIQTTLSGRQRIIQQYKSFPYGKHDDMVDEGSQGCVRLIKLITGETPKPERRFVRYVKWYPDMWEDYENMTADEQDKFILKYGAPEEWRDVM